MCSSQTAQAPAHERTQMDWSKILPILQLLWSAVSPELKAVALKELKALEVEDAKKPLLLMLIKEAEAIVAAV